MGITSKIEREKYNSDFYCMLKCLKDSFRKIKMRRISDEESIQNGFKKIFGRKADLENPQTLNEKIQWLKLHDRKDFHTICADKYAVRQFLSERYGDDYLIPLVFHTSKWREINIDNITRFPCIVKANHTSGDYVILRSPDSVNWKELRRKCRIWLNKDYYLITREWQYKNIKREIVVEELLQTNEGKIPNDYKLHYFNGELKIVYVSVDREGINKRNIYDENWEPLLFSWVSPGSKTSDRGPEIDPPTTFKEMKRIGSEIAKLFAYVRVDFYDVDGKLYFGEITLHHGGGYDVFIPEEYDFIYGKKLDLSK